MIITFLILMISEPEVYFSNPVSTPYGIILTDNYCNNLYFLKNNGLKELSNTPGCGRYYTLSPDKRLLGYKLITEDGLQRPAVYDLEKCEVSELHQPVYRAGQVSFSRDGKIAFTIDEDLIVKNHQGTRHYNLGVYSNLCPISPDGNFIVYNDNYDQLWILNLNTLEKLIITDNKNGYFYPKWSLDSRLIAYSSLSGHIKVYDRIEKRNYDIAEGRCYNWSPDSKWLIYHATKTDGFELTASDLYIAKYDGSEIIQLTNTPEIFEMEPDFIDGDEIIYHTFDRLGIWVSRIKEKKIVDTKILFQQKDKLKVNYHNIKTDFGSRDSIDVPYIHQVYDTPDWHNGHWSCAPTTAMMAIAYYRKLPYWDCWCSYPYGHTSHFGNYICAEYNYREVTYNLVAQDPSGNNAWGGYGYMWYDNYSPYSRMYQYLVNHNLNSWVDDTPTWAETQAEVSAGWPYCMCVGLTSAGHLVLAVGQVLNWHTLIFNDPYGNKNTPGYPSYDGKYARYDWPGYNNGYQNLNTVYWCRGARGSWPPAVDTIVDDLQIRYPGESYGFYMHTQSPSTMRFYRDNLSGYNGHFWWTYTTAGTDTCYVTWTPRITVSGTYEVYAYIPSINANANARYRIYYAGGNQTVTINQNNYSNQWVLLGAFPFNTSGGYVYLGDATGTAMQRIAFDAIRWRRVSSDIAEDLPGGNLKDYGLMVYPNPASEKITIRYLFPITGCRISNIKIYDVSGRMVKSFNLSQTGNSQFIEPGHKNSQSSNQPAEIVWNGDDNTGRLLPAGIYIIKIEADEFKKSEKLVLLK